MSNLVQQSQSLLKSVFNIGIAVITLAIFVLGVIVTGYRVLHGEDFWGPAAFTAAYACLMRVNLVILGLVGLVRELKDYTSEVSQVSNINTSLLKNGVLTPEQIRHSTRNLN